MQLNSPYLLPALFVASLILITLSLRLLRGAGLANDSYTPLARFFLIALRVAIGWHCFVEGMEKLSSPTWSSEAYLRESIGPLAPHYREIAGDRLIAKLTLGADDAFPVELEREWRQYFNAFTAYYELTDEQKKKAEEIFEQRKADTLDYLKAKKETVVKLAAYPPELPLDMTMKERLTEHERLLERVLAAEANFPSDDKDVHAEWKTAKADLAKWRGELKKSIDAQTNKMKRLDDATKDRVKKVVGEHTALLKDSRDKKESARLEAEIKKEQAKLWTGLANVLSGDQVGKAMPDPKTPMEAWRFLDWSDFLVKWTLIVLGAGLMLGLFSRLASFGTALLVLSFYLAMPPLPGWPEAARLEGHYLIVNKTLIEIIALFALTFIPTGRWAGVDGLLGALFCKR